MGYRKFHKLRVRFAELDLTQDAAARRAGMSPSTLSTRMRGEVPFTVVDIAALCRALEIPAGQISAYFFEDMPKSRKAG